MADIFDQVAASQPKQAAQGDIFDQVGQAPPDQSQPQQQPAQPGFLSRAYETSPLPGMLGAAKASIADFVKGPDDAVAAFHQMTDALHSGDLRGAVGYASKILTGSENPFSDSAKAVVKQYTTNALSKATLNEIPGAPAAKNYVSDIKAGNTAGAIGDVVGGVTSIAPMLLGDEASATKVGDTAGDAAGAVKSAAGKARALVSEDAAAAKGQPSVQGAVRGAAEDTAASEGVQPKAATSIRDAVQNTADAVLERSKGTYKQLDDLSGGRWQRFSDSIKNLRDKADEVAGIDENKFDEYTQRAKDIEQAQSDLVDKLVKDGHIDADTAQSAVKDYRKAQALNDLSQQVRNATKGVPSDVAGPESTPETVDANSLLTRISKMRDSGRLAQAIGEDNAAQLIRDVDKAARTKSAAINRVKLVKKIAGYAGLAGGAAVLGESAAHILGGNR